MCDEGTCGGWTPEAIVMVEFPTVEQALSWYGSADYAAALNVRDEALRRNLILIEGASDKET